MDNSRPEARPRKRINTYFDRCTGCSLCRSACSMHMFGGFNPNRAMIRITPMWENLVHLPVACRHCGNSLCLRVCPVGAIYRNGMSGAVVLDTEKCISCGLCSRFCPLGMIFVDPQTDKAFKCDLCGGDPECVKICPCGALEFSGKTPGEEGGEIHGQH